MLPLKPVINRWNKIDKSIFPKTNCTDITVFNGSLGNTLNYRITKFIRDITYINTKCLDILIGLILGDAYFNKGKHNVNPRIGFKQSIINFPAQFFGMYLWN